VADVVAAEISPVALRFDAEHHRTLLPAIADLTTDGAAGRVMAAFRATADEIPAVAAGRAAAVDTDVETTPVIRSLNHRRSHGLRTCRQIRRNRRCRRAEREQTCSNEHQLLHSRFQFQLLVAPKPSRASLTA